MKFAAKLLAGILLLAVLMIGIIVTLINPNNYKEQIQNIVQNDLNRQLVIKGNLGWTFFPRLGINIGELAIKNQAGFNRKNLLKINNASVAIEVFPLLKGEIKLGIIRLHGVNVNIISSATGRTNLDDIGTSASKATKPPVAINTTKTAKDKTAKTKTKTSHAFLQLSKTGIAGIKITDANIERQDLAKNSKVQIHIANINIGALSLDHETNLSLSTNVIVNNLRSKISLTSNLLISKNFSKLLLKKLIINAKLSGKSLPNKNIKITLMSDMSYLVKSKTLTFSKLSLAINDIIATGKLSIQANKKTKIRYDLSVNKMDLTPYLSKNNKTENKTFNTEKSNVTTHASPKPKQPLSKIEPDLSFLEKLNVKGDLVIAGIIINKINIGKITTNMMINNGKLTIKPLIAQLYDGSLLINASVSNKNKYQISSALNGVRIQPLLTDLLGLNTLSGITSLNFTAAGVGLSEYKLIYNLDGKGAFKLTNGKVYGTNLSQQLRIFKAKFNHKYDAKKDYKKQTDFASLLGKFTIKNAIVNNQSLVMETPVATLQGKGIIWPLTETLNYKLNIKQKSQHEIVNKVNYFSQISIPLLITGSIKDPKFNIDSNALFKVELGKNSSALKAKSRGKLQKELDNLTNKHLDKGARDKVNKEINHALSKWLH